MKKLEIGFGPRHVKHDFKELPEFQDERGRYKICVICNTKYYFDDYKMYLKTKVPQEGKANNIINYSWVHKSTCGEACKKIRNKQKMDAFRKFAKESRNKVFACIFCGNQYKYVSQSAYRSNFYCSRLCSDMDFSLDTLAKDLNIPKDRLKEELIIISEKIEREQQVK